MGLRDVANMAGAEFANSGKWGIGAGICVSVVAKAAETVGGTGKWIDVHGIMVSSVAAALTIAGVAAVRGQQESSDYTVADVVEISAGLAVGYVAQRALGFNARWWEIVGVAGLAFTAQTVAN